MQLERETVADLSASLEEKERELRETRKRLLEHQKAKGNSLEELYILGGGKEQEAVLFSKEVDLLAKEIEVTFIYLSVMFRLMNVF